MEHPLSQLPWIMWIRNKLLFPWLNQSIGIFLSSLIYVNLKIIILNGKEGKLKNNEKIFRENETTKLSVILLN